MWIILLRNDFYGFPNVSDRWRGQICKMLRQTPLLAVNAIVTYYWLKIWVVVRLGWVRSVSLHVDYDYIVSSSSVFCLFDGDAT